MILGVDFSSSPSARKPIVLAQGQLSDGCFQLDCLHTFVSLVSYAQFLNDHTSWIGGFDFPFALPREFLAANGWPYQGDALHTAWQEHIRHLRSLSREQLVHACREFCNARPVGQKFAHRACDIPAGSSPSMKWVNPPVAIMCHAGAPILLDLDVALPAHATNVMNADRSLNSRVALEAYPGFSARQILGRQSYKSDAKNKQTPDREAARQRLLDALLGGTTLPLPRLVLKASDADKQTSALLTDATGDSVDAVLCALQAAWGVQQQGQILTASRHGYGLAESIDTLEGWIVSVPAVTTVTANVPHPVHPPPH